MKWRSITIAACAVIVFVITFLSGVSTPGSSLAAQLLPPLAAHDPGPRGGAAGAGGPLLGLTDGQLKFFNAGSMDFEEADPVAEGLGPRFNLDSCGGCHSQPALG